MLYGPLTSFTVQATGQLTTAAAYRPVIVTYRNGSPVRLGDLGNVIDSVENDKAAAWYNEERSISLAIFKQPGTNTVAVAGEVRRLLPTFQKQLPAAASLHVLYDRSVSIKDSVNDVRFTLLLTLVPRRHGDFPVPAEPLGDRDSRLWRFRSRSSARSR